MASSASGAAAAAPAASGGGRSADHIAWEQSVKDAAANGGHKPDEHGEYRCRCESRSVVQCKEGSHVVHFQDDCLLNLPLTATGIRAATACFRCPGRCTPTQGGTNAKRTFPPACMID